MRPGSWLKKEIPNTWFFGILAGGILAIAIIAAWAYFSMSINTAQCGLPPADIHVMKIGTDGKVQWQTRIDSGEDDQPLTIIELPDGGFAISGRYVTKADQWESRITRLNRSGGVVWDRWYPMYIDRFEGFFANPDGGFFAGKYPGKIIVLGADGNVTKEIQFGDNSSLSYITPRLEGGFIAVLDNRSTRTTSVICLDPDGGIIWRHDDLPMRVSSEYSLMATSNSGSVIAGHTPNMRELYYLRLDNNGNETWNVTLGKSFDNRPVLLAEPRPGIYEFVYESAQDPDTSLDVTMEMYSVTYDENGDLLRSRLLEVSRPISLISEYDFFAIHEIEKGGSLHSGKSCTIVRRNDEGLYTWQVPVPPEWDDVVRIVPTRDGGCVVLGSSWQTSQESCCGV